MSLREAPGEDRSYRPAVYRAALVRGWRRSQRAIGSVLPRYHTAQIVPERVLVINGHPDTRSQRFCAALCAAYAAGARSSGADVRMLELGGLPEPSAIKTESQLLGMPGSHWGQALKAAQWAHRYVVVFPLWLNEPPPLLRQFFKAVAASGISADDGFIRMHTRKKARLVITMEMPGFALRSKLRSGAGSVLHSLSFAGVEEGDMTILGSVNSISTAHRTEWLRTLRQLGAEGS